MDKRRGESGDGKGIGRMCADIDDVVVVVVGSNRNIALGCRRRRRDDGGQRGGKAGLKRSKERCI